MGFLRSSQGKNGDIELGLLAQVYKDKNEEKNAPVSENVSNVICFVCNVITLKTSFVV